ncbi:hypothetical protein BVY03_05440 [bacterium K02(2017)]|nr:hypothetical protein BVY03_05440 [bacterium K02(2017)]
MWEGQVVRNLENPYLHSPSSKSLFQLRQSSEEIWRHVEHKEVPTIYGPVAQFFFAFAPDDVRGFRIALALIDFLSVLIIANYLKLRGLPRGRVIIYAWLPLAIFEVASSAHVDALMIFFVILGLYSAEYVESMGSEGAKKSASAPLLILSYLSLTLAILVKPVAVLALGFSLVRVYYKRGLALASAYAFCCALVVLYFYLPFLGKVDLASAKALLGGTSRYAADWRFNGSVYSLILYLSGLIGFGESLSSTLKVVLAASFAIFCLLSAKKCKNPLDATALCSFVLLLISSVVYPWYLLWFIPLVPLRDRDFLSFSMIAFSITSPALTSRLTPSALRLSQIRKACEKR